MIKLSSGIVTCKSAQIMEKSPVLAVGQQSKSAQNVSHRDDIHHPLMHRLIELNLEFAKIASAQSIKLCTIVYVF